MSLADAAANGHLQTHKTGADEIRSLRDLIERCLMRPLASSSSRCEEEPKPPDFSVNLNGEFGVGRP